VTTLITKILLVAVTVALIVYDFFVVMNTTPGDTISEVILAWALKVPVIAYGAGVLMGHLLWPVSRPHDKGIKIVLLVVSVLLLSALSIAGVYPRATTPILPFLFGTIMGHFLWSQKQPR